MIGDKANYNRDSDCRSSQFRYSVLQPPVRQLGRAAIVLLALTAWDIAASTTAYNTNTVAPTLNVSLNVQSSVSLTLATGSSGCAISAGGGGDYSMSFGNVNGLGAGTPTCGVIATSNGSSATYATTYQMTATYAGISSTSGTTVVLTTPGFTHSSMLSLGEGATTSGSFTAIPATGTAVSIPATSTGAAINRAMSVTVSAINGGSTFSGADSALVTFTLTVQ
jgi:hypothetical protein